MSKIYIVTPNQDENGLVEMIPKVDGMQFFTEDELAQSDVQFSQDDKVCVLSETSLNLVKSRLKDVAQMKALELLKDKFECRKILKEIYPDYFFQQVNLKEISTAKVDRRCVIKPQKGFFGTAVLEIDAQSDMQQIQQQMHDEVSKNTKLFSEDVITTQSFIIEQFIEGEEYAVDMFYDENGEPVIVNLYHHPMPKHSEYLQMLYYTSKEVFDDIYEKSITFFTALNKKLEVKNMALHAEFRLKENAYLPIEINPMRYGGMALGTMVYHCLGVNPYATFANSSTIDWSAIWASPEHKDAVYAYMIAYNGKTVDVTLRKPNIDKFTAEFTKVLKSNIYPYQNQLTFGTFVLKETKEHLNHILQLDFDDYFE